MISMTISPLPSQATKAIRDAEGRAVNAFFGAAYLLGTEIATRAMRLCPVDTGYLRASRYVTKPTHSGYRFELVVGFGAPYAVYVHNINRAYAVGQWKFLEQAALDVMPRAGAIMGSTMAQLMRANMGIDGIPEVHPTGPLIGPHIHPHMQRRRQRAVARQATRARGGA